MKSDVRIIYNKLLGGWFIVRGPHDTPLSGRFDTKEQAQEHRRVQRSAGGPFPIVRKGRA